MNTIQESHGNKKHNGPGSVAAAMRKGNRDAEMDKLGGGFRQIKKSHKTPKDYKREKVDIYNLDKYKNESRKSVIVTESKLNSIISESVKRVLSEMYRLDDNPYPEDPNKNLIYQMAYSEVDYLYNEGVFTYDDRNLCAMANGSKPIDYIDLIKAMLYDNGTRFDNEAGNMLRNYIKLNKRYGDTIANVEEPIKLAIVNFAKNSNCCSFI